MKENFYICVICMLLFKPHFSSLNVPLKKKSTLIFYRQMPEIKTLLVKKEATERL